MSPARHRRSAALALAALLLAARVGGGAAAACRRADYAIVGGGTAGCALAARLCEALPRASIVLLERAPPRDADAEFLVRAPRNAYRAWRSPVLMELMQSTPNPGLAGRTVPLGTGRTLGGSSAVNAGQLTEPPRGTASAWGLAGLDDDTAAELYARAARQVGSAPAPRELRQTYTAEYLAAAEATGFEIRPEGPAPGEFSEGAAWSARLAVTPEGFRVDSCTAYLTPVINGACAGRLRLIQDATVTRILFQKSRDDDDDNDDSDDGNDDDDDDEDDEDDEDDCENDDEDNDGDDDDGDDEDSDDDDGNDVSDSDVHEDSKSWSGVPKSVGVEYVSSSDIELKKRRVVRVSREVISCAGPYGSPKLLQLSGIGPESLLESKGVQMVKDLPVGRRTQHRPVASVVSQYTGRPIAPENNQSLLRTTESITQWSSGKGGLLGVVISSINAVLGDVGYALSTFTTPPTPDSESSRVLLSACLINPSAFGTLSIANSSPFAPPIVDTNLLGENADLERAEACLTRLSAISASFSTEFGMIEVSPANQTLNEYLAKTVSSSYHYVGGCAIGSVLDDKLRVYGVRNLRVVDASSIPEITQSAGLMWSTYMLAEFGARLIAGER